VFIFRLEDAAALSSEHYDASQVTPDGKVPVIYRVDMSNPATFFVAQGFPIHDKDVIYVSNSPIADLQKFINVISQLAFSVAGVVGTIP
jgi:polysaccharide export outer membrane protein